MESIYYIGPYWYEDKWYETTDVNIKLYVYTYKWAYWVY